MDSKPTNQQPRRQRPEDWPYQQWFNPATGENCPTSLSGEKITIRAHISVLRRDFQWLEKMSSTVLKKFQAWELFQQANTIGAYMPLSDEVDVTPLFQTLEKQIFIPAFNEAIGLYRMAKYTPELKKGRFGIPEPAKPVWAEPDELDLILVPGMAFDGTGGRVGRGGGFYDRLLPHYSAVRAGICFDFQCLENVPTEPHDCKMNLLITESRILKFEMNS